MRKEDKYNSIYLHPGESQFSDKPEVVYTVLGSCVAIVMRAPRLNFSAIVHTMLPGSCNRIDHECTLDANKYKYVTCSLNSLLDTIKLHGIKKEELEIKVFGGASVISTNENRNNALTVGQQNINMVRKIFEKENLKVKSIDVGGSSGRRLYYYTETGDVYLSKLSKKASCFKCEN